MAASYIKLFHDFLDVTSRLNYEEKGRLVEAMIIYARSGVETDAMIGNESFLFPMFKAQIDRDKAAHNDVSAKRKAAGAKGGKAKQANVANASKCNQEEDKDNNIDNDNDNYIINNSSSLSSSSYSLSYSLEKPIEEEREDIPMKTREYIRTYVSEMPRPEWDYVSELILDGMDESVIRYAIDRACLYGCSRWAYIRKILDGWKAEGVKTIGQARASVAKFEENKRRSFTTKAVDPNIGYQHHDYSDNDFDEKFMYDPSRDFLPGAVER